MQHNQTTPTENDLTAAWQSVTDNLHGVGLGLIQSAPDDAFAGVEALRYALRIFAHAVSAHLEPRRPVNPQMRFNSARIGGDNPDYRYGRASLDGAFNYLLHVVPRDTFRFGIGTYSGGLGTTQGLICDDYLKVEDLTPDADGGFRILIAQHPVEGFPNHLRMSPGTRTLTMRETLLHPESDQPAIVSIECLTTGVHDDPEEVASILAGIQNAAAMTQGVTRQFLAWTEHFAATPNEVHPLDPSFLSAAQGDSDTMYHNGYFQLPHESAGLEVRFTPPAARYWNIQATNHWLESLDPVFGPANLNNATSEVAEDGSVTVLFSPNDPGVPNWLDTAGHLTGCIALRVVGAAADAVPLQPQCRVLEFDKDHR